MAIARSGKIRARPWSKYEHGLAIRFLVLSIANWGCELLLPSGKMVADLRASIVRHFYTESFGRHPLMSLVLLADAARLDPLYSSMHQCIMFWHGFITKAPDEIKRLLTQAWQCTQLSLQYKLAQWSLLKNLLDALALIDWRVERLDKWVTQEGEVLVLAEVSAGRLGHLLRDGAQAASAKQVARRSDYQGLLRPDRGVLKQALQSLTAEQRNKAEFHLAGGGPSHTEQMERTSRNPHCPHCDCARPDWCHQLWECCLQPGRSEICGRYPQQGTGVSH
eukprot:5075302-Amphidinium_carterae.2